MNLVDVIIVVFALSLAATGYEVGLVGSGLPLVGFVLGALVGGRLGPALLAGGGESSYAPVVTVLTGLLLGAVFAVAMGGVATAVRLRYLSPGGLGGFLDGAGGAILMGALGLLLAWALGAAALNAPASGERELRDALQSSKILGALTDVLPPSGPLLNLLRHVDPVPPVTGPSAKVAAPATGVGRDPDVRGDGASVVKVLGTACGLGIEGSGWIAGPDLVVTNAHVVAGEDDTTVTLEAGTTLDATAVRYDPHNDLAILRTASLGQPALRLATTVPTGVPAATLGYPENGGLTISPARVGRTGSVLSEDAYGRGPIQREMTPFRGQVRSGNSGGPVVDTRGRVLTTVFAAQRGHGPPGGLGVPNGIVQRALARHLRPTGTGPCTA